MKKHYILILPAMLLTLAAGAKPRSVVQISAIAMKTLCKSKAYRALPAQQVVSLKHSDVYTVMGYPTGGYVIVSNDDVLPEVLGRSDSPYSATALPDGFKWWLSSIEQVGQRIIGHQSPARTVKPDTGKYADAVQPFILTQGTG